MLVECLCWYFNKDLTIMCNEGDTIHVALECLLLLLYAWNSCPVLGTDISWSLVVVGRKFAFPINYSSSKHWQLMSSPATVESYPKELASRLSACREVANLLVSEQHNWHQAFANSHHPDPLVILPLLIVLPVQMLARAMLESLNTNLPGHRGFLNLYKVHRTP
jgi:hypothetical protein